MNPILISYESNIDQILAYKTFWLRYYNPILNFSFFNDVATGVYRFASASHRAFITLKSLL
jgi:hypothetical protein